MCPSGWHLPSSTGTGSYSTLVQNYVGREGDSDASNNPTTLQLNVLGFTHSGYYGCNNGGLSGQSSYGFYWSHTPNSKADAYGLRFGSTGLYPHNSNAHGYGFSLRCLAR